MPSIAIVPAAGKGARFGPGPKLLAIIDGVQLLERTMRSLLDAGVDEVMLVVAPTAIFHDVSAISDARVQVVKNPDPSRGMFSSIQAGFSALVGRTGKWTAGDPILILPADMPFVRPATIAAIAAACAESGLLVSPVYRGVRGHPVAMPAALGPAVLAAAVDSTLSDVLASTGLARRELPVEDPGVVHDVDEPRDLQ